MRFRQRGAFSLVLWCVTAWGATFDPQGASLTVATSRVQARFDRGGLVAITNLLTGEAYLRAPSSTLQVDLPLTQPPSSQLAPTGSWTVNQAGTSATLTLTDSNRTVTIAVSVDSTTQQIVVNLDGQAKQGGVETLNWGITGFDLSAGEFIIPGHGGLAINGASFAAAGKYSFFRSEWE